MGVVHSKIAAVAVISVILLAGCGTPINTPTAQAPVPTDSRQQSPVAIPKQIAAGSVHLFGSSTPGGMPLQVFKASNVVKLTGSGYLDSEGSVWLWGSGRDGRLGDGQTSKQASFVSAASPQKVPGLPPVADIAAGPNYSSYFVATEGGEVYAWGQLSETLLGRPATSLDSTAAGTPTKVPGLRDIVAVRRGQALDRAGTVWVWGEGGLGQLGDGKKASDLYSPSEIERNAASTPRKLEGLPQVRALLPGSMAISTDGDLFMWGTWGHDPIKPTKVEGIPKVRDAARVDDDSIQVVTQDGKVLANKLIESLTSTPEDDQTDYSKPPQLKELPAISGNAMSVVPGAYDKFLIIDEQGFIWGYDGYRYGSEYGANSDLKILRLYAAGTPTLAPDPRPSDRSALLIPRRVEKPTKVLQVMPNEALLIGE